MWGNTKQVKTTGAQLLNPALFDADKTSGGINYAVKKDGSIIITGQLEGTSSFQLGEYLDNLEDRETYVYKSDSDNGVLKINYNDGTPTDYINKVTVDKKRMKSISAYIQFTAKYPPKTDHLFPMLNRGTVIKPFEPYTNGKPAPAPDNPAPVENTENVTVSLSNGLESQDIYLVPPKPLTKWDKLYKTDGVWVWAYQSGYIRSYTGQNVGEDYVSTTGGLDTGAEIFYKADKTECIPLTRSEQDKLNALTMYAPETEITNDGGCNMELTYTVDTKKYVDTQIADISRAVLARKGF